MAESSTEYGNMSVIFMILAAALMMIVMFIITKVIRNAKMP